MPYVRTVKTKSGATAVQVVWSPQRGSRQIEHIGSAHDEAELQALRATAAKRIAAGQPELDLGLDAGLGMGILRAGSETRGALGPGSAVCDDPRPDRLPVPQLAPVRAHWRPGSIARACERWATSPA